MTKFNLGRASLVKMSIRSQEKRAGEVHIFNLSKNKRIKKDKKRKEKDSAQQNIEPLQPATKDKQVIPEQEN